MGVTLARRGWSRAPRAGQGLALHVNDRLDGCVDGRGAPSASSCPASRATRARSSSPLRTAGSARWAARSGNRAVLGLGLSVVLVAGTGLIAPRFHFGHDQLWMRTRLALWGATLGFGLSTHWVARMTAPLTERRLRGEVRVVESRERGAIFRDGR